MMSINAENLDNCRNDTLEKIQNNDTKIIAGCIIQASNDMIRNDLH